MEGSAQSNSATRSAGPRVVAFEYPVGPDAPAPVHWEAFGDSGEAAAAPAVADALRAELEKRHGDELRKAFEAGRERGRQEGRQAEREASAAADQERRRQTLSLADRFVRERDRYLHLVEHEVVELALAIAARILRREAQMDPLLLTGAVRVALGQLSATTELTLRVPASELDLWAEAIALLPNLAVKPAVAPGDGMRTGDCGIESSLGSVDLGLRAQLAEIERGFFDRQSVRQSFSPAAAPLEAAAETRSV